MKDEKVYQKDVDVDTFLSILKKYKIKVSETEETAKRFLVELGVITEKGNLKKNYEHLCIPEELE